MQKNKKTISFSHMQVVVSEREDSNKSVLIHRSQNIFPHFF